MEKRGSNEYTSTKWKFISINEGQTCHRGRHGQADLKLDPGKDFVPDFMPVRILKKLAGEI